MATQEVTSPIALDETLQNTNTVLGLLGKDTTLQSIVTALASLGINTIGSLASLVTTDKTSLVGAVNELAGDIDDLDTDKADKVTGATNGNLAKLDANGNLADGGWSSLKTTTSATGNPISISGLKSNQLAIDPIVTFSSAVSSVTLKVANNSDTTASDYAVSTDISESLGESTSGTWNVRTGVFTKSNNTTIQLTPHEVILAKGNNYVSTNGTSIALDYHNGELASLGDVSQLGETVNALGDRLTAIPKRNEQINITSYNSTSNRFTVPTDGYITCHMPTSGNNYIRVGIYDKDAKTIGITQANKADVDNAVGIFVKKGMLAMITMPSGAGGDAWFRGIDYITP